MERPRRVSQAPRRKPASRAEPYSQAQIDLIRAALNAHFDYAVLYDGKGMSWAAIGDAVSEYTGQKMGGEVVRRFAGNLSPSGKPGGPGSFKAENINAIVQYLSHPDIAEFSLEELEAEQLQYQAPVRLMAFLKQEFDDEVVKAPASLTGVYHAQGRMDDAIVYIQISLKVQSHQGIIQIDEGREVYDGSRNDDFFEWDHKTRNANYWKTERAKGWAVLTPEDSLFGFMKRGPYAANHYWFLAEEVDLWSGVPVDGLVLTHHDYPCPQQDSKITNARKLSLLAGHIHDNLYAFRRVTGDKHLKLRGVR